MKRKSIPFYNHKELKRQEIIAERQYNRALAEAANALKAAKEKEEQEKLEAIPTEETPA